MKFTNTRTIIVLIFFLLFSRNAYSQLPVAGFTVIDADGCAPHTANFTSTSTGSSLAYLWDFGDLNTPGTSNLQNPAHIYQLPGQYSVKLIVSNANGTDSIIQINIITVFKGPTADYTVSEDTACPGQLITFTDNSIPGDGAITQWEWTFNDGSPTITGSSTVMHSYINSDSIIKSFLAVFKPTDINGCNSIFSADSIHVYPSPSASFNLNTISCVLPANVSFTNNSSGPSIYTWDFGDPTSGANNSSNLSTPSHTYNSIGSYLVTLTNGFPGCTAQDTMTVKIDPPVAAFTVSDSIICRRDTVFFTNTSTPLPLSAMTFRWTFGDISPPNFSINPFHVYLIPGNYTVTLTTSFGNCSSTVTHTVIVPPPPSTVFSSPDNSSCSAPFDATFNADTTSLNVGWQWNFGDPGSGGLNNSSIRDPLHTYTNYGFYTVQLIVTDIFGCRDTATVVNYVQVLKPVIDFSVPDSGCVGSIFNYNAVVISPADPVISDYTWNFGDGTPVQSGTSSATSHQFDTIGIFDVTLTVTTQSGCTSTLTKSEFAKIGTKPNAMIDSVLESICFKGTITFNDLTPAPVTGWKWDFGDSQGGSTQQNPVYQYNFDTSGVADPFDIILIAYYNGCADSDTVVNMITVLPPIPLFDTIMNCLNPFSVDFINLSSGADSLFWDFGDGSPVDFVSTNPTHIYAATGNYTVKLTAKNVLYNCSVDTNLMVFIRNIDAIALSSTRQVCFPGSINFTGSTSQDAATYEWTFGEGIPGVSDTSNSSDTIHLYSRPGYYIATLMTTDIHNCAKIDTEQVHIIGPTPDFTADILTGCSPINVTFKDNSQTEGGDISSWQWDFGDGSLFQTTSVDSIAHLYNFSGFYDITLIVTDVNLCTDTLTKINFINPTKPSASIIKPGAFGCSNSNELFVGDAGPPSTFALPVTYTWKFGDGQTFSTTSDSTNHIYASNGNYIIGLKVADANGCVDSTTSNVFLFTTSAHFTYTTSSTCVVDVSGIKKANVIVVCNSDSTDFTTNAIYDWDFTADRYTNSPLSNYTYNYDVPPGSYDITLILTNDLGCKDTLKQPGAIVIPGPTGSFSFSPDSGCSPLTVEFTGFNILNSNLFAWDFGDGNVLTGTSQSTISHTYTSPDTYHPQFLLGFPFSNETCYIPVPDAGEILVTSVLSVNILEDSIAIKDGETGILNVTINDPSNIGPPYNYVWDPASNITNGASSGTFIVTPNEPERHYNLSVPYGTQGCSGLDRVKVIYLKCDEITADTIPNVFTPNGDFVNDTYFIKDLCDYDNFNIRIFNRWGKLIYESTDPGFHWDGNTTNGTEANEGVYYYLMNTKTKKLHGYINLIRNEK